MNMRYARLHIALGAIVFLLVGFEPSLAQAEKVDVRQITFHAAGPGPFPAIPSYRMLARRANGVDQLFVGNGDPLVNPITECTECPIPITFSSNVYQPVTFPDGSPGMQFSWGPNKFVHIHVDSVVSPPFVIDPRQRWKPHEIFKRVTTTISGGVEIFDENGNLVQYDDDVTATGITDVYFSMLNNDGRRVLSFEALISILNS